MKSNKMNQIILKSVLALLFYTSTSLTYTLLSQSSWVAPESANKITNSIASSNGSIKLGKILYKQYCAICHGDKGKGDGLAGMSLKPRPANFTKEDIQKQSDGAIYWKLTEGKSPMAGYKETLSEKQRWHLVNYIRSLKK